MITQKELLAVIAVRTLAEQLSRSRKVRDFTAELERLAHERAQLDAAFRESTAYKRHRAAVAAVDARITDAPRPAEFGQLEAARANESSLLEALKKRYRKNEEVETGPLRLHVESTPSVAWQKVLDALRELPAVAKALLEPAAAALLAAANRKDRSQSFTSETISRFDVVPTE